MRLFQAVLDTPLDSPFSATLSVHGLHFTVCTPSIFCRFCSFSGQFSANFNQKQPNSTRNRLLILEGAAPGEGGLWLEVRSQGKENYNKKTRIFLLPKGPSRTKNAIALKIVVKHYCGSILLSVQIRCLFFHRKRSTRITIAVVNYYRGSELLSR